MKLTFYYLTIFAIISILIFNYIIRGETSMIPIISNPQDVSSLFPKSVNEIEELIKHAIDSTNKNLNNLYELSPEKRDFKNTLLELDKIVANLSISTTILYVLNMVHPNKEIRQAACKGYITLHSFSIDHLSQNIKLYNSFKEYVEKENQEKLDKYQKYFLQETLNSFERSGLDLPLDKQDQLKKLRKKLSSHEHAFENNISNDNSTIEVTKDELEGLSDDFVNNLNKTADNKYILSVDYPTYVPVMENCKIESTRKSLWTAFINRGYPANESELSSIINIRDEIAKLLKYETYASYDIEDEMAKSTSTVKNFLEDILLKSQDKLKKEIDSYLSDLPAGISLTKENKIKPWDVIYIRNQFKKKNFQVNEFELSQYFPLHHTLSSLFLIYESFFGLDFKKIEIKNLWHEDVQAISVYKNNKFLGYILLDLFPRPNKYSHACEVTIVPTFDDGKFHPALILVIANFPKPVPGKPSLLLRSDVITFFHEFGHAIHAILGCTPFATNSGAAVKHDFVEMPSQMLEEWMWQPEILKKVSSHYKTKEPLSEEMIAKIIALKNFNIAEHNTRQVYQSFLSLDIYNSGSNVDIYKLNKELFNKIIKHVEFNENDHFYSTFGHLTSYGPKYYSYLWSKVYALDLFNVIKEAHFSKEIGQKYIDCILSKGGSYDPMVLLEDFLGRKPNSHAFISENSLI